MITLYGFGPDFGLPDLSPFVMKTETQLKMAGLSYRLERASPRRAPKGKLPYIEDEGRIVADSTFIRRHLERSRGLDLDAGLAPEQRAAGWAVERMLEDHLYWALLHLRWADDANFAKGPSRFFAGVTETAREEGRARFLERIHAHGLGRHDAAEIAELGQRSLASLSALLGEQLYLFGSRASAADATALAMFAGVATPFFDGPLARAARGHANLVAYRERMMARFYPDFRPA